MKVRSRFSYFRDKLQVFFLGLLFGLVIGGGFFVLKLDQYVKELSFYKSLTQKDDKTDEDVPEVKTETEKPKTKKLHKEAPLASSTDSTSSANAISSAGDTTLPVVFTGNDNSGEIVIRKDEQLGSKNYSVISLDKTNTSDSIPAKETSATNVSVEFWKSPLNYHGYKFTRNKLVLFGYSDTDLVSIYREDNATFLKCLTGVFRIEPTTDFHQLERVTDETLLARLQ